MKSVSLFVCGFFFSAVLWISCVDGSSVPDEGEKISKIEPGKITDLDNVETDLPEAPGYQTFYSNCVVCHSPRYIQNQPDMPEKSWAAIVNKMQKTFGAPVSDSSAAIIVQYLTSVKGT